MNGPPDGDGDRRGRGPGEPEASAGSLLLTLLGEFVLPGGRAVWTSTFTEALAALDIEEKAARQALARSAGRGLLRSEKIGRRVRWELTDSARRLLEDGTERIYRFGLATPPWDGRWLLLFCSLPEARRELRYRLRVRLGWVGLGPFGPGAWLSPWAEREAAAVATLTELALRDDARTFIGGLGTLGDARDIAAQAWPLDGLAERYRRFLVDHGPDGAGPDDGDRDAFIRVTNLVHRWRQFPGEDPGLPAELLPAGWPGSAAAAAFHARHRGWSAAARRWWDGLEAADRS
ncbi:MAG: PaaX family transcriptional regulator C-terminal domain-containing protein [Acidimicrobiia bacterium]